MPALFCIVLGVLLGVASGGQLRNIAHLHLRLEVLVLTLFVVQALARGRILDAGAAIPYAGVIWVASSLGLAYVLTINRERPGLLVGAVGVLLNVAAVLANGAMPVLIDTGGLKALLGSGTLAGAKLYAPVTGYTSLAWLGDVLATPIVRSTFMLSPGDILLAIGIATAIVSVMVERPAGKAARSS